MQGDDPIYERRIRNPHEWWNFSIEHTAFALHRISGWLLLGWVVLHLGIPTTTRSATAVWIPGSKAIIVGLLVVFVFHGLNGIRLLVTELTGTGAGNVRLAFQVTVVLCAVLIVVLGGLL